MEAKKKIGLSNMFLDFHTKGVALPLDITENRKSIDPGGVASYNFQDQVDYRFQDDFDYEFQF